MAKSSKNFYEKVDLGICPRCDKKMKTVKEYGYLAFTCKGKDHSFYWKIRKCDD